MKVITKILNVVVGILVLLGVFSIFYWFIVIKPEKVNYQNLSKENNALKYQQDVNDKRIIQLQTDIYLNDITIKEREATINSLYNDINKIRSDYEDKIKELKDITLEEALDIIINYYGYTSEDAQIIRHENEIRVVFNPSLVHEIPKTLIKLESSLEQLSVYQNQVIEYDSLICDYINKVSLLEDRDSLQFANYELEVDRNSTLEEIIANRNDRIKSIKLQRGALGIVVGIVIVLALL